MARKCIALVLTLTAVEGSLFYGDNVHTGGFWISPLLLAKAMYVVIRQLALESCSSGRASVFPALVIYTVRRNRLLGP